MKRKFKKTRQKTSIRGKLLSEVDALFRQYVLKDCEQICEWCLRHMPVQIAHILPKGKYPRLRYHQQNILLLCYHCHLYRWHKDPMIASRFLDELKGKDYRLKLLTIDQTMPKLTNFYLYTLRAALKIALQPEANLQGKQGIVAGLAKDKNQSEQEK